MRPCASASSPFRASIPAVPDRTARPSWSVMIPTYNCGRFLAAALQSVLAQDQGPERMQIEVIDDASDLDDPEPIVQQFGQGRVGFMRQTRNVGHIGNFETCLKRATGRLIHLLHGDDAVRPGFYEKLEAGFTREPEIGAAFCRQIFIDEAGHWQSLAPVEEPQAGVLPDALARLAQEQRIMTPSIVVRREVYERLGGFDARLKCSEDWEMWVRIAASYPIWYEPEPLALYRMHDLSNTGRHLSTAEDMSYTRHAIEIFRDYLPADRADGIGRRARSTYSEAALANAERMLRQGDRRAFLAQFKEALHLSRSPATLRRAWRLLVKSGAIYARGS